MNESPEDPLSALELPSLPLQCSLIFDLRLIIFVGAQHGRWILVLAIGDFDLCHHRRHQNRQSEIGVELGTLKAKETVRTASYLSIIAQMGGCASEKEFS
jgi:hypothetical protein